MAKRGPKGPNKTSFKKGQCGNPTGETRKKKEARELALIIREFLAVMVDGNRSRLDVLIEQCYLHAAKGSSAHLQMIWERAFGKAVDKIEFAGPEGAPIKLEHGLSDAIVTEIRRKILGIPE